MRWERLEYAPALQLPDVLCRATWCFPAGHQHTRLHVSPSTGLGQVGTAEQESATVGDRELGVLA